jgi:hypothetical protein
MQEKSTDSQMWDEVIGRLSGPSLQKDKVAELVGLVSKALGTDTRRLKVFPKGIPWPDGIVVHTVVDPRSLSSLVSLLQGSARIDSLRIFPRGIINPEVFLAEIEMS